jgi:nitrate reductase (NAD(P)H)
MRPYTPTRPVLPEEEDGTFDLLIKTYFPESSPFPPGGTLGNYLDVMTEGETIDINGGCFHACQNTSTLTLLPPGPIGDISYLGNGSFEIDGTKFSFDRVNLVAGGSGITPHWQLIHSILKTKDDRTQVSIIDSNKTFSDILLHKELEKYAGEHGDQFKLWFALSKAPEEGDWKYSVGRLDEQMMRDHFFLPDKDGKTATFLCGPPGLIKYGALPALKKIGFEEGKTCFGF